MLGVQWKPKPQYFLGAHSVVGETDINQISINYNCDKCYKVRKIALRSSHKRDFTYCIYWGEGNRSVFQEGQHKGRDRYPSWHKKWVQGSEGNQGKSSRPMPSDKNGSVGAQ